VGIKLAHYFEKKPLEYNFAGFLDNDKSELKLENINDYFKSAYEKQIEKVYLIIDKSFNIDTRELFNISEKYGIKLKLVNDIKENHFTNFTSTVEDGFQFFSYRIENLEFLTERFKKRLFDIVFSILVLLFLLSWLYPILAIIIKFQSKGPVIFKQIRNGRSNRPFYCYKFRSMRNDNPDDAKQAQKNDSRFTKIGAFMRRTNLDELPQFFNVLIGEMSVVGPRPHMTIHNDKYQKIIEKYLVRNFVKPGITGWAQVNGFRGETKEDGLMEKRVLKDIEYLGSWTLMFDVRIVFLTIYLTFKGDKFAF
jgi:exopolysaccharide biosynthesis polyprenyl glycosylphosphotransferase